MSSYLQMMNISISNVGIPSVNSALTLIRFDWVQVTLLLLTICCLLDQVSRRRSSPPLPLPPGPWGWPVIGNLPQLGRTPHCALTDLRAKYGDVFMIQLGSRPTVVLNGLATIKKAIIKQAEDFAGRPDFYTFRFIANGKSMGFGDYGARWKAHRRIAQNALCTFVNDRNNPMEKAIQDESQVLIDALCESGKGPDGTDPHNQVYLSVGNIICALCFGKRYQRNDDDFKMLIKMNGEFMAYAGAGNPVDIMPWTRHLTKWSFNGFLKILHTMDQFCLKKRKEHLDTYDSSTMRDVTDMLIKATQEMSEEEKQKIGLTDDHILTTVQEMIGAGFDTIATTLQWAVLFMATHPHVQSRVQREIDENIGNKLFPSMADMGLGALPYTEATILEIMRHSCIFPFALPHATTCDTVLQGHFIPDKTLIFVNLWSITRDPQKFPDPERFEPMRFLDGTGSVLQKEAMDNFLPFGAGRRKCPGEPLGKMEIFIFFTSLLQHCTISKISGVDYSLKAKYGLTLKPQDFKVRVTKRH